MGFHFHPIWVDCKLPRSPSSRGMKEIVVQPSSFHQSQNCLLAKIGEMKNDIRLPTINWHIHAKNISLVYRSPVSQLLYLWFFWNILKATGRNMPNYFTKVFFLTSVLFARIFAIVVFASLGEGAFVIYLTLSLEYNFFHNIFFLFFGEFLKINMVSNLDIFVKLPEYIQHWDRQGIQMGMYIGRFDH